MKKLKQEEKLMKIANGVLQNVVLADIPESGVFEIPESVTSIGISAFWGCSSLKEIHLSESITSIGSNAFDGCESLKYIKWGTAYYSVRCIDGYCMHILSEKQFQDYKILKCHYFPESEDVYVAERDGYTAHGKSIRKAVKDVQFKILRDKDTSEHIKRIAEQGYMNANDYRLLTGACHEGTARFLKSHNLTWDDTMSVQEVLKLTENHYGFEHFKKAAEQILQMT